DQAVDLLAAAALDQELLGVALGGVDAAHVKQAAHGGVLVARAHLELVGEAEEPAHVRVAALDLGAWIGRLELQPAAVGALAAREQVEALADVEILVARGIELDGDVEGEVPALEDPGGGEVGLELGDRFDDELEPVELVLLLEIEGIGPEEGRGESARAG